jgi:hypothetical protein
MKLPIGSDGLPARFKHKYVLLCRIASEAKDDISDKSRQSVTHLKTAVHG